MEGIMTLAQRKAAKKSNMTAQDASAAPVVNQALNTPSGAFSMPNITVEEAIKANAAPVMNTISTAEVKPSAPIMTSNGAGAVSGAMTSSLSTREILELAAKHGLTLQAPKKEFVKHTYSVTTDSKALFKKYCDVLGLNMQDAMEESLQDFFKKHALEYSRVKEAKRG